MNEQTSDLPVLAVVKWKCDACDARGNLNLASKKEVPAIVDRLKILHAEASPECSRVKTGPTELALTTSDVPDDAVVNDPLEKRKIIGGPPTIAGRPRRGFGALLGAMVGAIAAPVLDADAALAGVDMPEPARRHLERHVNAIGIEEPTESPYSRESRALAREESRARNAQLRRDAAEAKRQRKADRRRGQP